MFHPIKTFVGSLLLFLLCHSQVASAMLLEVGSGYPYSTLEAAANDAAAGDTILVHAGTYPGGIYIANLQGTASDWIYIHAAPGAVVIYDGGTNAWQFTDAAYLHISGFVFQHQVGNGLNFDDGGSYESPAHHVIFENCTFRDMNASGNNDLLKLSGLDSFEIRNCLFFNGSAGGSGIDMVGCHDGLIRNNHFENLGSNSIQAKGGTANIRIEANFFKNGGARALNLGGSTGLQFFRPINAPYEAAELKVYSNVFIGSEAPVAFVGSINCEVVNNTIYLPGKWVMRILQETVDETRFPPCGYNTFRNNIVYIDNSVNVDVNIGPNTAPETFTFSNNLWFHSENSSWNGPDLPAADNNSIVGQDPLFEDAGSEDFSLLAESPAIGNGYDVTDPELDHIGNGFLDPRSIGAFEGGTVTGNEVIADVTTNLIKVYPNPIYDKMNIEFGNNVNGNVEITLTTMDGRKVESFTTRLSQQSILTIPSGDVMNGMYFLEVKLNGQGGSVLVMKR